MEIKVSIGEIVDKLSILLIKKIKKNINLKYKSNFIEEKSYNKY